MKCAPMCFTYHLSIISELRASDWRVMCVQGPCWPTVLGPFAMKNWVPIWSFKDQIGSQYFKDRPQWLKKRSRYLSRGTRDSIVMSAHVFLVFLGHLIFWIGMFKGFRSNGLEILILKHMWKSIIGPLEQIEAENRYVTFFLGHPVQAKPYVILGQKDCFIQLFI